MNKRTNRPKGTLPPLAKALGITARQVSTLLGLGMPDDPAAALKWKSARELGDTSATALRKERILLVRAQREKIEQETKVRTGKLVDIDEVGDAIASIGAAVRGAISRLEADLPPMLEGMAPAQMQLAIREKCDEVLGMLEDESSKVWGD